MLGLLKSSIKRWLRKRGYFLLYVKPAELTGFELEEDLRRVVRNEKPVIIDVGGNEGQTIEMMQRTFTAPRILSFEPSPRTFAGLNQRNFGPTVTLINMALGAKAGTLVFHEYERSDLSSALEITSDKVNPFRDVQKLGSIEVPVGTVDATVSTERIAMIDLLKIDTQGFDLEVLRGAENSLSTGVVKHVLVELNFSSLYEGQASAAAIHAFLEERGFALVDYYERHRRGSAMAWCTALFCRE
jgi:FkbM family methyltransferase